MTKIQIVRFIKALNRLYVSEIKSSKIESLPVFKNICFWML